MEIKDKIENLGSMTDQTLRGFIQHHAIEVKIRQGDPLIRTRKPDQAGRGV